MKWYKEFLILWIILTIIFLCFFLYVIIPFEAGIIILSAIVGLLLSISIYYCYSSIKKIRAEKVCGLCGKQLSILWPMEKTHWGHLAYRCGECSRREEQYIKKSTLSGEAPQMTEKIYAEMKKSPTIIWRYGLYLGSIFSIGLFAWYYTEFVNNYAIAGLLTIGTMFLLNLIIILYDKSRNMFDWIHSPMMTWVSIVIVIIINIFGKR